jgi:uncharacterized protein YceH (UPF0502 family)
MSLLLDPVEVRVLGALLEKEITTPEYYPLTLNALVNACNQKSNREPVVSYDDEIVDQALGLLREKRLAFQVTGAGMRVPKFGHRIVEVLNLGRRELAILCELMVRGPQTVGELRNRSERMHRFDDLEGVETCLRNLAERPDQALVKQLERQPGTKEPRWAHLLSGDVVETVHAGAETVSTRTDRVAMLENEVRELRERVEALERQWQEFNS